MGVAEVHLFAVEGVDADRARVGRGAGAVGRLVDVFAVNVDRVGDKGRPAIAAAGVALFKAEDLELGLDAFKKVDAHGFGKGLLLYVREEGTRREYLNKVVVVGERFFSSSKQSSRERVGGWV